MSHYQVLFTKLYDILQYSLILHCVVNDAGCFSTPWSLYYLYLRLRLVAHWLNKIVFRLNVVVPSWNDHNFILVNIWRYFLIWKVILQIWLQFISIYYMWNLSISSSSYYYYSGIRPMWPVLTYLEMPIPFS